MSEPRIREEISIDIGSTNSQIVRKYIDLDSKEPINWKENDLERNFLSDIGASINIPTILLKWVGNPDSKPDWDREIPAGNKAEELSRDCHSSDFEIIREFKKDLFTEKKTERYEEACEYVKEFLSYLKEISETNMANSYVADETITYITVPARSAGADKEKMQKIAESAGWKNVEICNEAESALDFAVYKPDSELISAIEKVTIYNSIDVLMIDIGGSTTDIIHAKISPDGKGGYRSDYKAQWPSLGETDTLGSIDIDKAIKELMLNNNYLLKSLTEEEINKYGYEKFRKFKEKWSNKAKAGEIVPDYGDLQPLTIDFDARKFASELYTELDDSKKLNKNDFENLIHDYIIKLQKAIRSVLQHDNVEEKDLDYVILAGGGSSMYGIEEMILGKLDIENPLDFTKIKNNPKACIHGYEKNPSAMCCLGNLFEKKLIECRKHCIGKYDVEVSVYTNDASVIANYSGLNEKKKDGLAPLPESSKLQYEFKFDLAADQQMLPIDSSWEYSEPVILYTGENIFFRITVYRTDSEQVRHIENSWLYRAERTLRRTLKDFWEKYWDIQERIIDLKNTIDCSISENHKITVKSGFFAEGFSENYSAMQKIEL